MNIALNDSLNADNDRFDAQFDLQGILALFQAAQYKVPGQRGANEASGGEIARETISEYTAARTGPAAKPLATRSAIAETDNTYDTR